MQRWPGKVYSRLYRPIMYQLTKRYQSTAAKFDSSALPGTSPVDNVPITTKLEFLPSKAKSIIPKYRIMDTNGNIINKNEMPNFSDNQLIKMYKDMTMLETMDNILFQSQRQERISFYMTHRGEEATQIGSAAALDSGDLVYAQYREAGILLYRGYKLHQFIDQCMGNARGSCKGIQMPIHYGSKDLNYVTISSTVATQMPQAVGSAYAYKRAANEKCVVCYFGDGATSEGDAHAAFNFAATLEVSIIFICRNNGYAISTPSKDQYHSDGIASRGTGYGMMAIRVDGHDLFAVYNANKAARQMAVNENKPILIEVMVDRFGPHSTSDDSSAYRSEEKMRHHAKTIDPIERVRRYMDVRGCWNNEKEKTWRKEATDMVLKELEQCEHIKRASITIMFDNVFEKVEPHLQKQMHELMQHVQQNHEASFLTLLSKYEQSCVPDK
ncbi:unnamed protein product [Rotaria magnacalcarata]